MLNWSYHQTRLKRLQQWYLKYERLLIPGALALGFITDLLTFRFINFDQAMLLLFGHVLLSGAAVAFIDLFESGYFQRRAGQYGRVFAPLIIQYSFGAILSASVIFYSHSGSLLASWPFIIVLIFLMIANEILRKHYTQPMIQLPVYFFAVYSYAILLLPFLFNEVGEAIFMLSSFVAIAWLLIFGYLLWPKVPLLVAQVRYVAAGVLSVVILMNIFYFTNLIPPFPLAIKDIGVYHQVDRSSDGGYELLVEDQGWLSWFRRERLSWSPDMNAVYVFTSVFLPAEMRLPLVHHWQHKNPETGHWQSVSRISYEARGGREDGFRSYSLTRQLKEGRWRVRIQTKQGQTVGQVNFFLERVEQPPELERISR